MAPSLLHPLEFSQEHRVCEKSGPKMGKTRKVSSAKGEKYGFVSDYRHAVVEASEGYGSSAGRVDVGEGGDESCAPSRGKFGVQYRVFALGKMSSSERRELRTSLERELEQVRGLQKSIERTVPVSGSKKRKPGCVGNGVVSTKGGAVVPNVNYANLMKQCETLLTRVMKEHIAWVFNEPVDVVKLKIPDYFRIIKHPMDLGTVKTKLLSGRYADPWGFVADVRLTFKNAMTYNPKGNDVHVMAHQLSKFFEVRWKTIEKKLSALVVPTRQSVVEIENVPVIETVAPMPPLKKKKIESFGNEVKQENVWTISVEEVEKLQADLLASIDELPEHVNRFLREHNSKDAAEDEFEIDFDNEEVFLKLRKFIDDHLAEKQKNMEKAETCEIELHNESGSNSSMEAYKAVNDGNDEDIDIGGDDLPMSSFPPIEIEKDTAKCESSSSSSDSGSSSSDSESDSSSDSEVDGAKAPAVADNTKDIEVDMEQITIVPQDSVNGVGQVDEQKSHSIPVSGEVDGHQEGESAPPERQVSPDKLYRAALLRSRFADTILKAQEKTNGKVEEPDRERLRLEKEEFEKRRKAEKARLQAEAKAAEEAHRNAELAAAAEAKRKRELEREAARQALQKMEKMVDINDNSRFLEDLEMLTVAPAEPLESLIDETSADGCQDPLGSFSFKGKGNPLEQLGLFMKNDDDEEVDVEEEGEIY